ncbi:MAG: Endo,4-beta-xylanase precursor [Planctomycetota bacterium]|jgi:hypothetical protein
MGVIQFVVERPDLLSVNHGASLVDFLTFDGRVTPARVSLQDKLLRCERATPESGQLRMLWPRFDHTRHVVHSTSLREQSRPYELELELARGQLSRLRDQFYAWHGAGLQSSPRLDELIREAHRLFRSAALRTESPETSSAAAVWSMEMSAQAADLLCAHYTSQRIEFRRQRSSRIPVFFGCQLDRIPADESAFLSTFNAVQLDTRWSRLEQTSGDYHWQDIDQLLDWAARNRLFVIGGPLIDMTNNSTPDWMSNWTSDPVNLQSFAADYVETVISRYMGRVRHWEIVSGANRGGAFPLSEEQRFNLLQAVLAAAKAVDDTILVSLRVVQPWGEYLSQTPNRLSPIQFFDAVRRSGVRIGEINLDIRVSSQPQRTLLRDPLSLSHLIDHWSCFQIPINVMISVPDIQAASESTSEECRDTWLRNVFLMCLSKERVAGIYVSGWQPGSFSAPALLDFQGQPGRHLQTLQNLSREFLS